MQRLEVSGAVRLIYRSLGVKGLISSLKGGDGQLHAPAGQVFYINYYTGRFCLQECDAA